MKVFYALFLLVFLASCTKSVEDTNTQAVDSDTNIEATEVMDTSDEPTEDDMMDDEEDANTKESEEEMDDTEAMDNNLEAEVSADIDTETDMLDEVVENEVVTLDASYTNPKGPVDMTVTYSLDENDVIESIEVSATTYDVSGFNAEAQSLVGQDISAAESFYVAGGSLTSEAFTAAIKNR